MSAQRSSYLYLLKYSKVIYMDGKLQNIFMGLNLQTGSFVSLFVPRLAKNPVVNMIFWIWQPAVFLNWIYKIKIKTKNSSQTNIDDLERSDLKMNTNY